MNSGQLEDAGRPAAEIATLGSAIKQHLAVASDHGRGNRHGVLDARLEALFTGAELAEQAFVHLLGAQGVEGLLRHGILSRESNGVRARLALCRLGDLLIVTDLPVGLKALRPDTVDPLWEAPTLAELMIDAGPGGTALDLGSGSGILALLMAESGSKVFGGDVNPRALSLSRFNAALNGIDNVSFHHSDLFAAFTDHVFQRIVSNTPTGDEFVPTDMLRAGQGLLESLFRDLPERLAPGGVAQFNVCGQDWADAPFLERVDRWLGPSASEFQYVFLEKWRIDRGPRFVWHRLRGSIATARNCMRCTAVMRGWLTLRRRRGPSWRVRTPYQDWGPDAPAGTGRVLIEALLDTRADGPAAGPSNPHGEVLHALLRSAEPVTRGF